MTSQTTDKKFRLPLIETARLELRVITADDLDVMEMLFNDNDVQKYLAPANRRTREQLKVMIEKFALNWQKRGFGIWCVCLKDTEKMIGYCGFQYLDNTPQIEILFGYLKDYWGHGFATEAAHACLRFGCKELGYEKLYAIIHPENLASRHVLEKLGMIFDKKKEYYQIDSNFYVISAADYKSNNNFYEVTRHLCNKM